MHRRKRVTGQNERRNKVCRRDNNDEDDDNTLVISDSESDEEEDCATTVTSRTARRRERKKKAHVQDMTEDEMLDLALRLSKQEANCATQREQVEDDDMKKAIAESLQASCSQASKMSLKQIRSAAKPHKDQDTVSAHVRCKLSFTGRNEKDRVSTGDVKETQASAFKCSEDDGSLLPMPDLSQRTPSRPSPPSVRAATQESSSSLGCMEDGALDSESLLKCSPVFLRHCSVRLNPNVPSVSESVRNIPHSSVGSPTRDRSQSSPLPSKSPVFPKTDSKRCSKLPRRKFSDGTSSASFTAGVHEPEDTVPESSSHECSDGDRPPKSDLFSPADSNPLDEFTSHMVLHLSDGDDGEESDKIIPPSPVFPQDRTSCAGQPKLLAAQLGSSSPKSLSQVQSEQEKVSRTSAGSRIAPAEERTDVGAVSYYWGIPFCPKGQSPDDYTKVILAQLEVYEKSLKEAQRQLLRKADWGFPVFPCPVEKPQGRRLKRHRAPRLLEEEEEEEEGEEENETKKQVKQTEREESQSRSEDGAENGQHETYVVVSSPETQEELVKSPSQFKQRESTSTTKHSSRRKPLSQDLSDDTQIKSEPNEHVEEDQNGRLDVESAVCPETQMTEDSTPELMVTSPSQTDADVMELDEAPEPSAEADERMEQERPGEELTWTEPVSSRVECPMCTRLFPLGKIEMHAAYCNGTVEEQEQQESLSQGSARRRTVRKTAVEDDARFEKSEQQEKCYLCNKFFTSKEYSHHVDQCLQLKKAPGPKQGNGLLSALNRTETVDPATVYPNPVSKLVSDDSEAGPSNTTIGNNRNLTGGSVTPDGGADYPGYYVSSSPIKSFTPISEIKDCLIDFKQQYPDRTSQRLGRKRKFKR